MNEYTESDALRIREELKQIIEDCNHAVTMDTLDGAICEYCGKESNV